MVSLTTENAWKMRTFHIVSQQQQLIMASLWVVCASVENRVIAI